MSCCKKQKPKPMQAAKLGGWAIEPEAYSFIINNIKYGSTILELGSGVGTEVLSEKYKMVSIEHNIRFIGKYNSTYIHAPMINYWYDIESVQKGLPEKYDMILIDGPIGSESKNRIGFWENIGLFNTDVLMLFDDTNRDGERHLFEKCLKFVNEKAETPRKSETFKTFSVIYGKV